MTLMISSMIGFGVVSGAAAAAAKGELWTWGRSNAGQGGRGNTTDVSSPNQVGSLTNWAYVSGEFQNHIAVTSDGKLFSWGHNGNGELGHGNTTGLSSPVQVGSLTNWATVHMSYFTIAVKTDGTLWTWGHNVKGALGHGNTTGLSSPVQVGSLTNWATAHGSVNGSTKHVGAVKTDGTLWMWGYNRYGKLGLGNTTDYSSPKQVGSLTDWAQVSTMGSATVALKTDGTIWSWGWNNSGRTGRGTAAGSASSPIQIGSLTNWAKLSGAAAMCVAVKTDGTLWGWGENAQGGLGTGNTTTFSSPVQVGSLTDWANATRSHADSTFAIKTDGTAWTFGKSQYGELGHGNTTNISSPVQLGSLTTWIAGSVANFHMAGIKKA